MMFKDSVFLKPWYRDLTADPVLSAKQGQYTKDKLPDPSWRWNENMITFLIAAMNMFYQNQICIPNSFRENSSKRVSQYSRTMYLQG